MGFPKESDFIVVDAPLPSLTQGQALVKTVYLSVDPYMRGRITGVKTYADPVNIGDVMEGRGVGQVVESKTPDLKPLATSCSVIGVGKSMRSWTRKRSQTRPELAPVSTALGVLGMPGMTAYFGFLDICKPQPGETVLVSGAAGAVGSLVGQIAKIKGCRVVGIAGADDKINWLVKDLASTARSTTKRLPIMAIS